LYSGIFDDKNKKDLSGKIEENPILKIKIMSDNNRAIVRGIADTFDKAVSVYFGTGPTDVDEAKRQHDTYVASLRKFGVEVKELATDNDFPDCCFVEDQVVICDGKGLLTISGHDTRAGEQDVVKAGIEDDIELTKMTAPARMDGGDVIKFGKTYLCGISTRTNKEAAQQLRDFVAPMGYTVHEIAIPSNALHLKSIASSPGPGLILAPRVFFDENSFPEDAKVLWIPEEEVYGANSIGFDKDVLVAEGFPHAKKALEDEGFTVHGIPMGQIEAGDGSLTCLSVFY